ncbi:hypothetical protein [Curtobacterium sp. RRHDQ10]|uniref:hypothetical protein n=1 Tax=Curtobacterium phyllosphaerae TaxID=3413379 RepID=UPI003BF20650
MDRSPANRMHPDAAAMGSPIDTVPLARVPMDRVALDTVPLDISEIRALLAEGGPSGASAIL